MGRRRSSRCSLWTAGLKVLCAALGVLVILGLEGRGPLLLWEPAAPERQAADGEKEGGDAAAAAPLGLAPAELLARRPPASVPAPDPVVPTSAPRRPAAAAVASVAGAAAGANAEAAAAAAASRAGAGAGAGAEAAGAAGAWGAAAERRPARPRTPALAEGWRRPRESGGPADGLPPEAATEPLLSCGHLFPKGAAGEADNASATPWARKLQEATRGFCSNEETWGYMDLFLDVRFVGHFSAVYGADGWTDEAWVNFIGVKGPKDQFGLMNEKMVDSLHRFSRKPVIVVNFGRVAPPELDPGRFPRMVMLHARRLDATKRRISFNFNKLRAILLARVKVGASIEADMMMVSPEADALLARTREEINEQYPLPMMPTHFLDRDPAHRKMGLGNYLLFQCRGCPKPTLRWGQAQPTWTYWSLPFLGRWLAAKLTGGEEQGVPTASIAEDEDLLNVALWREGASKAWCAWQMGGTDFVWENFVPQHPPGPSPYYSDPERFPKGIPIMFFFGHAEKKLEDYDRAFELLERRRQAQQPWPKPYFHNMEFFRSGEKLFAKYPDVKCLL